MANVDSIQVEINAAMVERIQELESELNKARASEVNYLADIAQLWQERDKLRAERDALTAKLADMPDYYSYLDDDDAPAVNYDEWVMLGKPATWFDLDHEKFAIANEIARQERMRKRERHRNV